MDFELIFWCVFGIVGALGLMWLMNQASHDEPISERTMKRIRGEWYK